MKEKTFKCGFCTSNFILNISLKIHVESFHEAKTFKCDFCSSSYTEKGNLKRHMESIHEGKNLNVDFAPQILKLEKT